MIEDTSIKQNNIKSRQLNPVAMMVFISILSAFPMMATDMYLPATPLIKEQLNTSIELVNSTLSSFFFIISFSGLIFGPLSDRFGRKPVVLTTISVYVIASLACAVSTNIYILIVSRIFQAIGCGSGMAVPAAIVKDYFPPEKKEKAFALIGALTGFVPMIAPLFGAKILEYTSWRGIFFFMSFLGLISLVFTFFFKETNMDRSDESIPASLLKLGVVLRNMAFTRLVFLFAMAPLGMMAFIGISSFIFQKTFGLSETEYSIYFGINACISVLVALAYIRISRFIKPLWIITISFPMSIVSGILTIFFGQLHPALFLGTIAISVAAFTLQRPPAMNILLEQQDKNTGSATSLMNCFMGSFGSLGLVIISLDWANRIFVLGVINVILGILSSVFWLYTKKRCRIPKSMISI
jgi:DHA1 family bicyclomycin/chloramphenicol resistance-like MFS transporter